MGGVGGGSGGGGGGGGCSGGGDYVWDAENVDGRGHHVGPGKDNKSWFAPAPATHVRVS